MSDPIYQQMSIFDDILPRFKVDKKIRLIEFFSGIGAQAKALEILGVPFEHHKTCEWAYNSYCAYNSIHIKDNTDYSKDLTKEQLIEKVNGTSINYNEPLTTEQLNKKPLEWLKSAYNNIVATHNLVNIMNVKGKDLEIKDKDKYVYCLTYSFPCQDLSLAGKRQGMSVSQAEGGTRSGLLWEVERILTELYRERERAMPDILIMENVPEVCGSKNVRDFEKWQGKLQKLGYTNYCEILNAKDYGIPQNRRRCFMISILGDYNYTFPKRMELKLRLKDLLEKQVDEKYYLSKKMIDYCLMEKENFNRKEVFLRNLESTERGIAGTLTTKEGSQPTNPYICVRNATEKGFLEATDGDGVDISGRMQHHRGTVQKDSSQTLTCMGGNDVGVVVNNYTDLEKELFTEDGNIKRYLDSEQIDEFKDGQMATTTFPNGYGHGPRTHNESIALNTIDRPSVKTNLRIRKLTPKECLYLMGFEEKDYNACREIGLSDAAIYHVAGDSIVSTVLVAIFSNLVNELNTHGQIINGYVERLNNE